MSNLPWGIDKPQGCQKIYKTVSRRPSSAVLRSSVRSQRPDEGSNESGAFYVSTCTESVGAE